jgi:hypothetical protein
MNIYTAILLLGRFLRSCGIPKSSITNILLAIGFPTASNTLNVSAKPWRGYDLTFKIDTIT